MLPDEHSSVSIMSVTRGCRSSIARCGKTLFSSPKPTEWLYVS